MAEPPGTSQPDHVLPPGTQLGQYRIVRFLGQGGMASVYEAIQTNLDRPVALKVMAPLLSSQPAFRQRFIKEAQTVARLSHPNIVSTHDFGEADLRHFLAMEYVSGGDLKQRIGRVGTGAALQILREIASALAYAHRHGFVHRDVKPENILFHEDGQVMLSDFGIAMAVESTTRITGTGMSVGTPHYMSPEQCQGEHDIDGRSDLYSLGVVFYEMLTGNVPFDAANTVGIVMKHVQAPIPQLPPGLQQYQPLLDRLLAKNRNDRYGDAGALIEAIDALSEGRPGPARKQAEPARTKVVRTPVQPKSQKATSPPPPAVQASSKTRGVLWGLGGAALATILGLAAWYAMQPTTQPGGGASLPAVQAAASKSQGEAPQPKVTQSTPSPLERQLATPPSGLRIEPSPVNARVYVDDVYAGSGSLELTDLQAGASVSVRVEAEGYEVSEQQIEVPMEGVLPLQVALQKVLPKYALTVETDPRDARVRILNIEPKYQPGMLLEPGRYHVEVSKPGHRTVNEWLTVTNGPINHAMTLPSVTYALTIRTEPADATVRLLEPAMVYRPGMALTPGVYRYEVSKPGYHPQEGHVRIEAADVSRRVTLERSWQAGDVFRDCPDCPEMVVIPAGNFMMGSPPDEVGRGEDEGPQHRVTISKPFAFGRYEVTFDEYDAFARATNRSLPDDKGWGRGRRPVVDVSWGEAQAYAKWLSNRTARAYRLPSEAEWEYAARAGRTTTYWWGNSVGRNKANCNGCASRWDAKQTAPVGSFDANPYGLFDVHGNVWEWTQDCWKKDYSDAPLDGSAWVSNNCPLRQLRGGSWANRSAYLRVANRLSISSENTNRKSNVGFRVLGEIE